VSVFDHAVQAAKQEYGGKAGIVQRPRSGLGAGPQRPGQMIDDDIVDEALVRSGRRSSIRRDAVRMASFEGDVSW
jgi:hypothetical protein